MKNVVSVFLWVLLISMTAQVLAEDNQKKLFVNLTSDNMDRAVMAVSISSKVLSTKKIPVTIFLSAQGVRWADKNIPQNKYINGKTIPDMFQDFIKSGGQVIICKMCMVNVGGMKEEDVINGVKLTGVMSALFADNTTVLTY